jgi:hypothetical protein
MVMFADTAGSGLDSVIVPRTANLISVGRPGRLRLARVIAARSDPGPALAKLVTVTVCAWRGGAPGWEAGRVGAAGEAGRLGAAAAAPSHITPDMQTPAATSTAAVARAGIRTGPRARIRAVPRAGIRAGICTGPRGMKCAL